MALQDCVSLAYRGEWKPFSTVHQSGRPKSAGAPLGRLSALTSATTLGSGIKFDARITGKHVVYPNQPQSETSHQTGGRLSLSGTSNLRHPNAGLRSSNASTPDVADLSPVSKTSPLMKQQRTFHKHSRETSSSALILDDAKAQKYKIQNMTALIYHSVQQGCTFIPRVSSTKKTPYKESNFAPEAASHEAKSAVAASARPSSAKKRSNVDSSGTKPLESTSELVAAICDIRADLRTNEEISVLMRQIQSNAFFSKLPEETLRELCRVMKVQSYYRKDRVFIQGDLGEHFFIILEGKCVVYKELTMQQANEMQLDLSGNDPSISVSTVANKDWNLGVMTALRAKGASMKILEKVKSKEKTAIVKKIVEIKQKLQRLGDSEDPEVRTFTEALRRELAEMTEHLENILEKIGKFSGDVLQTQVEETIQDALRASGSQNSQSQPAESGVFDAHELSTSAAQTVQPSGSQLPENSTAEIVQVQSTPLAAQTPLAHPTYTQTQFLSADSKVVIKKLVELSVGAAFGEIALENANSKRTATIVAETDCKLLTITRADYRHVLSDLFAKKKAADLAFLNGVPIFSKLNPRTVEALQSVMTNQAYRVDEVILEAESETSDFYIIMSGIVRVVMRMAFEDQEKKTVFELDSTDVTTHAPKVRNPTEMTVCKLGIQNTFGEFYVGNKKKSPVAFVADSPQVVILRLSLLDCQHYLANDVSVSSQLMNFARRKSEFYLAQCKAMLKTKERSYQLASATHKMSSSLIPYPSEAELMALIDDKPKPPRIKTDITAWTRLFPTKHQNQSLPSYWRHDAWREVFEKRQHDAATALNKIDEFAGVTVVGTHVRFPAKESKFDDPQTATVKQRPVTATRRVADTKQVEHATRPAAYSVKNRTLNLQSWDMPVEHHVNVSNRVDSSAISGQKKFYYSFDPDEPDADYLEELDLVKLD